MTGELSRLSSLLCANVASCLTHHSHRPSPPDSFIPGFKTFFSTNRSRRSLPFLFPDWLHGFPGLFTDTSAHICFYFLLFLFSTFWLLVPCGRLSWLVSFWAHVKIASRIVGAYRMFTDNGTAELAVQQAGSRRRSCCNTLTRRTMTRISCHLFSAGTDRPWKLRPYGAIQICLLLLLLLLLSHG